MKMEDFVFLYNYFDLVHSDSKDDFVEEEGEHI
jgi:hypothetical protein